ncbi:hypothetical protein N7461_000251 [Penicillium sp. DV-2018c]|nr:hypothetical protein N7461_000251 [Penicillium sp. DV-2018c]
MDSTNVSAVKGDHKVWEILDPEKSDEEITKEIDEPELPPMPQQAMNETNQMMYRMWGYQMDVYKVKLATYERQQKGLAIVNTAIKASIHENQQYSLEDKDTARQRLLFLKSRFGQSFNRFEMVRKEWKATSHLPPKKDADVDKWLSEWLRLYDLATSLKIQVVYAERDFLEAVKDVNNMRVWWTKNHESIVSNNQAADVHQLAEEFRSQYSELNPKTSSAPSVSRAAFATLHGQSDNPADENQYRNRNCPCGHGRKHRPWNCWVINENAPNRPPDYDPPQKRKEKVERELKADPGFRNWINQKINEHQRNVGNNKPSSTPTNQQTVPSTLSTNSVGAKGLRDRWILDNGASMHICNDRSKFINFEAANHDVRTGDNTTRIEGHGKVRLRESYRGEEREITLENASYSPGFHTNLVSYGALKKQGVKWDEEGGCIRDSLSRPVLGITFLPSINLWRFDLPEDSDCMHAYATRKSAKPLKSTASLDTWHRRMGHVSQKVVRKAEEMVEGMEIGESKLNEELCEVCKLSSAPRQISRRSIGQTFGRFGKIYFDLIQMNKGYNGHQWITHFYVEGIRFHWLYTHAGKDDCRTAVERFIALAKNWWNLPIKAFHYDNERSAGKKTEDFLASQGIVVLHSVAGQPEQNGPSERSGGLIIQMTRNLRLEGKLPNELWPEMTSAAVWMLNRIPTLKDGQWIVPWEEARKDFAGDRMKPTNLSNLRIYGSLAYCRIRGIPRKDKLKPRAEIGFLVGYIASNIWKIWFPARGKIEAVRDTVFDENRRYHKDMRMWEEVKLPEPEPTVLSAHEAFDVFQESVGMPMNPLLDDRGAHREDDEGSRWETSVQSSHPEDSEKEQHEHRAETGLQTPRMTPSPSATIPATDPTTDTTVPGAFPSDINQPQATPPTPTTPTATAQGVESQGVQQADLSAEATDQGVQQSVSEDEDEDDDASHQLHQEIKSIAKGRNEGIDLSNIIEGPRTRRSRHAYATVDDATIDDDDPPELLNTFGYALYTENPIRRHRDDLPPEPDGWREMQKHPYRQGFEEACRKEIEGLSEKGTFEVIDRPRDVSKQVIPLRWVFKYKFDQDGYLTKLKARICVRGDLEWITPRDKRAATLAARTARMLFSLVAAYDLDLRQRDDLLRNVPRSVNDLKRSFF